MESKIDMTALFKLGYGLYVITSKDGDKDNGLIVNTVFQLTDTPVQVAVTVNKQTYSHDMIMKSGAMNVNCLTNSAPFSVFQNFGFQSGRDTDKLLNVKFDRSENGISYLTDNSNAFLSLKVEKTIDLGTHTMFICTLTEAKKLSNEESMTYAFYHANVKPKPEAAIKKTGYVCKICGYVYEGDELPEDFVCPLCKHGAADFEKI